MPIAIPQLSGTEKTAFRGLPDIILKKNCYRIGVVDDFKNKVIYFNSKTRKDTTHGNLIVSILKNLIPNADITTFGIKLSDENGRNYRWNAKSVLKQLKKISNLPNDKKFDYLNLSMLFLSKYNLINPHQLHYPKNIEQIRTTMPKTILHIIEEIEKIEQNGTKVFVSAGNRAAKFNLLSLAGGAHTVGGIDDKEKPIPYFTQNSLIKDYARLPYNLTKRSARVIDLQLDLSKLSKYELKKRIANKHDYKIIKNVIENINDNIDFNYLQYNLAWKFSKTMRGKIYDIHILSEIFGAKNFKEFVIQGTHCDISMRQFFDMKSKSERHVIPTGKSHKIKTTISGTSFAVPQAIAKDIKLCEAMIGKCEKTKNIK